MLTGGHAFDCRRMTRYPQIKLCRNGVTRIVLLIGPWAVKLPRFDLGWRMGLRGLLCNMTEREGASLRLDSLCPLVFAAPGGWLNVMKRARPLTDDEWLHGVPNVKEWPIERKRDNWGMIGGRIVAVDYGEPNP